MLRQMLSVVVFSSLLISNFSVAETRAFFASGPMTLYQDPVSGAVITDGSFEVIIHYDPQVDSSGGNPERLSIWSDVSFVSYTAFDGNGNVLTAQRFRAGGVPFGRTFAYADNIDHVFDQIGWGFSDFGTDFSIIATDYTATMLDTAADYPDPSLLVDFAAGIRVYDYWSNTHDFIGNISFVMATPVILDSDGDGLDDDLDQCPESALNPKVVVSGNDSGVVNVLQVNGCTVQDDIDSLLDTANKGRYLSNLSLLTNHLRDEGVISGNDKGKIQSAAAR